MIEILLVDDHPSVMEGTKVMLEEVKEINVTAVNSGVQALEPLKTRLFDVLLVDLNMPGLSGVELVRAIKSIDPNVILLIYSGYDIKVRTQIGVSPIKKRR